MNKGVKYLISGLPSSGKTTATIGLQDCYVLNADYEKKYPLTHIHTNVYPNKYFPNTKSQGKNLMWTGVTNFKKDFKNKLKLYKELKGSYPKVVIIDTITSLYSMLVSHNTRTIKNVYGSLGVANTEDTAKLNNIIESLLINNGIDVVILSHAVYDEAIDSYKIPAEGSKRFASQGSWLSCVDYASFIWNDGDNRYISHKRLDHPCRSLLKDIPDEQVIEEFSIQDMLDKIRVENNTTSDTEL